MSEPQSRMSRSRFVRGAALAACVAAVVPVCAAPDAQAILAASDEVRNPAKPFGVVVTLIEYRSGKQTDSNTLFVLSKADTHRGQYHSLIRFVAPPRDANKLMLKSGNELWFFDPASKASIRISPQQRLLGQAAIGDVLTVNLAVDYAASLEGPEAIQDAQRQPRPAWHVVLKPANDQATYGRVDYWVDRES